MNQPGAWRNLIIFCTLGVVAGCAPAAPGPAITAAAKQAAPKTLRIPWHNFPAPGLALFDESGTGSNFNALIFHSGLTWPDSEGNVQPLLAAKIPSLSDGDWKVLPDGRMEVSWRLRADVRWHDGRPLEADDLMLGMRIAQDLELTRNPPAWLRSIASFSAPDPATFVLTWSELYFLANRVLPREIPAVASHLVGPAFEQAQQTGDKQAFLGLSYWHEGWVGLGPYRLSSEVAGDHVIASANEDYFLGRPKIDRLHIRYFPSVDVAVLAVLAGDVDFVPNGMFSTPHVYTLKQQWEPTGAGTVTPHPIGINAEHFQFGDPTAPWAKDVRVRRGIAHMYDRQALVDSLEFGTTTVADVVVSPRDPVYKLIEERGMPRYEYDLAQSHRLMNEAGWTKGPDGLYRDSAGSLFDIEMFTKAVTDNSLRRIQVSADILKQGGLNATFRTFPNSATGVEDRRYRSTFKGLFGSLTITDDPLTGQTFVTPNIRVDSEGVSIGTNVYRYSNPAFDALFDRYRTTLDPQTRNSLRADLIKFMSDDLVGIPLFYGFLIYAEARRNNVRGPTWMHPTQQASGWLLHIWDIE